MKDRTWIILIAVIIAGCAGLSLLLIPRAPAVQAVVTSGGEEIMRLDLSRQQEFTVTGPNGGVNTVTVRDGSVAVTVADCPDQYCVHQGFRNSGTPIVCLPNTLVISFSGDAETDFAAG